MRFSHNLIKTNKEAREYDSVNATLLLKAGFVHQTMAGVYSYLPLGMRVLQKIEDVIREEMDTVGAEVFLPAMVPKKLWEATGRLDTVDVLFKAEAANDGSAARNDAEYVLNSTHEEVITPIAGQTMLSYRDLPFAVYQIQTKFRNEERPKSGLMRGREFRMKDLYSFHVSDEDRTTFYDQVKNVYVRIFDRLGIGDDTVITLAGGGDFTKEYTHEFQTKLESGEDIIYYNKEEDIYYNQEVAPDDLKTSAAPEKASEVGNIFPLGTKFTEAINYTFTDEHGNQQPVFMASYGIGSSRVLGVLVEKFHDDNGIVWPEQVAPFTAHLVSIAGKDEEVVVKADAVYEQLTAAGIEVLYDDRDNVSPGEKLGDADLIGCPWRLVVSAKTGTEVEVKRRTETDTSLLPVEQVISTIAG